MSNKNSKDIFEYVYSRKELHRQMWIYLGSYVVLRIIRLILLFTFGYAAYMGSIAAMLLIFMSGIIWGMAIITVYYYRKSVKLDKVSYDDLTASD